MKAASSDLKACPVQQGQVKIGEKPAKCHYKLSHQTRVVKESRSQYPAAGTNSVPSKG